MSTLTPEARAQVVAIFRRASKPEQNGNTTSIVPLPIGLWRELADALEAPCDLPPPGWRCTRAAGHEGPCAAVPVDVPQADRMTEAEELEWQRLELMKATPITFDMALRLWGDKDVSLNSDKTRECFFAVWALAARELADAMIEEAGK